MKFELGRIASTPAASEALKESVQAPDFFLDRHVKGDWGDVDEHDQAANERALVDGERLLFGVQNFAGRPHLGHYRSRPGLDVYPVAGGVLSRASSI